MKSTTGEKEMDTIKILEALAGCKNKMEVENLWTKTYLENRGQAYTLQNHFDEMRASVVCPVQVFSAEYRANGWD